MLKLLIGPIAVGVGYAAGSYYGSDAEQLVHKKPSTAYAAVEQAIDNIPQSGTTSLTGGTPVPYAVQVDRSLDRHLTVTLLFNGRPGVVTDIDFKPQDGGASTLIASRIHADRGVLRPVLAGTSKARLAYAPDWMFNLTFKPVLQQLAAQIEQGGAAQIRGMTEGDLRAQWESNLSDDQREQVAEERQYDATRPSLDLSPNSGSSD